MALSPCPACSNPVSEAATTCPRCGCLLRATARPRVPAVSGSLVICCSCNSAVAKSAITCGWCNAQLKVKGLNVVGVLGLLVMLGSIPGCLVVGVLALVPMLVGLLLTLVGRSYSPRMFVVRRLSPDDHARLGLSPGAGAWLTPNQERLVVGAVLLGVCAVVWVSATTEMWSSGSPSRIPTPATTIEVEPPPRVRAAPPKTAPSIAPPRRKAPPPPVEPTFDTEPDRERTVGPHA
jgi:hypothetical protein